MRAVFGKKKDKTKSKNRDVDSSLSDVSKINASSISLSTTEITYISTPSVNQSEMRKNKAKEKAEERKNDVIETSLSSAAVLLGLVNEAAQFAPVPGLQNAASLALGIVTIVQGVKESNRQYSLLAKDATDFVASIWRSYQNSSQKDDWLSPDLREVISELVVTLAEITEFVEDKIGRSRITKIFSSNADVSQVQEYRGRINSAIKNFELASHLKLNDLIHQMHRDQLEHAQHLKTLDIETIPTAAILLHALGKSPSGYDIPTSTNSSSSLVALSSSVVSSQSTSAATSPRASDQRPDFFTEAGTQSPQIVLTPAETLPPADSTASNSPQPSSPPMASSPTFSPASQPLPPSSAPSLSPPTSLPSSPSFTGTSISTALSGSVSSSTVISPTLVGSPESDRPVPTSAAVAHCPSSNPNNKKKDNAQDNDDIDDQDEPHDINISVDATHAPLSDAGPDDVRIGRRMPTTSGNAILKGVVTASPSGTASESESRSGRSPTPSDTDTAVSEGDMIAAATRHIQKERELLDDEKIDDDDEEDQYGKQPPQRKRTARAPPRTDTDSTLTSERRDTLKSPPPRREQRQTTVYEEDEQRYDSPEREEPRRRPRQETAEYLPARRRPQPKETYDDEEEQRYDSPRREEPRRRPRQETEEYLEPRKRPQPKPAQEEYDRDEGYDRAPTRPARGPVGRPGPQRGDTARYGRQRGETYDDEWEEEKPRRAPGKGKAPQKNHRATVQNVNDEEEEYDEQDFEQEEHSEGESHDYGNVHLNKYVAGARRKADAVASKRIASAAAVGSSARKAAAGNDAVGKDEKLSIKFSKININARRNQQPEEEDDEEEEDEEEEEEPTPPPPKKRRPKRPQHEDSYNQHGHYNHYPPDPYHGAYPGPYPGYHHPPPPPQYPNYYAPSPPPRYGPGALGFIPGLGYGAGNGTSSTVTMSNVGNDNSVHIITNKIKKSKRREG